MDFMRVLAEYRPDEVTRLAREIVRPSDSHLGFHTAGSAAGREVVRLLAEELDRCGADVATEPFPVDTWEFHGAWLHHPGRDRIELASFGGSPAADVAGRFVHAGCGTAGEFDSLDVKGAVVGVDFDFDVLPWYSTPQRQAAARGAVGLLLCSRRRFGHTPGALLSHDLQGGDSIPVASIRREDLEWLREHPATVRLQVDAERRPGTGNNIVVTVPGTRLPEQQVLLGDHFDGWFQGFIDDAVGAATCVEFMRALSRTRMRPDRTLRIILHDAEEYGRQDTRFDWLTGSWSAIRHLHRDWIGRTVAALMVELHGMRDEDELSFDCSPELRPLLRRALQAACASGPYHLGEILMPPRTWTDAWSYAREGIPAACNLFSLDRQNYYHTQYDTEALFDEQRNQVLAEAYIRALADLDGTAAPAIRLSEWPRHILSKDPSPAVRDVAARLMGELDEVDRLAQGLGRLSDYSASRLPRIDELGRRILAVSQFLHQRLLHVGGESLDTSMLPFEQAAADRRAVERAAAAHTAEAARTELDGVTAATWLSQVDAEVADAEVWRYTHGWGPDLQWAEGRLLPYLDTAAAKSALQTEGPDVAELIALRGNADAALRRAEAHTRVALEEALRWAPLLRDEISRG